MKQLICHFCPQFWSVNCQKIIEIVQWRLDSSLLKHGSQMAKRDTGK